MGRRGGVRLVKFTDRWRHMWTDTFGDDEAAKLAAAYSREAFDRGDVDEYVTIIPMVEDPRTREEWEADMKAENRYALFTRSEGTGCWNYEGTAPDSHARIFVKVRQKAGLEYRVIDLDKAPTTPWDTEEQQRVSPRSARRG
jgi:hypothetical protein